MCFTFWITRSMVGPRWLMMTPLAWATACGIGTGPAPIRSSGSVGRMAARGVMGGGRMGDDVMALGQPGEPPVLPDTAIEPAFDQSAGWVGPPSAGRVIVKGR